jgi:hypothetical protein
MRLPSAARIASARRRFRWIGLKALDSGRSIARAAVKIFVTNPVCVELVAEEWRESW